MTTVWPIRRHDTMGPTRDMRGAKVQNSNTDHIFSSIHCMYAMDTRCQCHQRSQGMAVIAVPAEGVAQLISLKRTNDTLATRQ
jgi:hypothetical protein